jgi:hypothetical protein
MVKEISIIYFYIPQQVILLDLSSVLEVFQEAKNLGLNYQLKFISNKSSVASSSGLVLSSITHFLKTNPKKKRSYLYFRI